MGDNPGRSSTAFIVVNPAAGRVDAALVEELVVLCRPYVTELSISWTHERGDAATLAADAATRQFDVVIAVGGDGTVREMVQGLLSVGAGADLPSLLIVPGGTGNSNYLAQWGSLGWPVAVTAALTGSGSCRCLLDLARLVELDILVLLGACSGLIAQALVTAKSVSTAGRERYRIALAQAATEFVPYPGRVLVDGVVVHSGKTILANVGGGRHRGGTYELLPRSVLDDGLLDVCVIDDHVNAIDVPGLTLSGAHVGKPGVTYARGRRITVERTDGEPLRYEHDGELGGDTSARFTMDVIPRALPVLCRSDMAALNDLRL